ncbi:MAG: condensation domain-containing protein, partial [Acidobacteriota bacterium]
MKVTELLADLVLHGVQLWVEADQIVIRAPKGVLTPLLRSSLAEHKDEILAMLRNGKPMASFPLSYNQRSLWLVHQLAPHSTAYNVAFAAYICSEVDVVALRHTFQRLVDRHPSLRTTYTIINDEPMQQVHGHREIDFEEIPVAGLTVEELHNQVVKYYRRPFDLQNGPLLRVSLFTQSKHQHVLLVTIHHIACDGASLVLLLDEFGKLYPAEKEGRSLLLPDLNRQYIDYVHWQREMLGQPWAERQWEYWRSQLAGDLPVLKLPSDRPRPAIQTYTGATMTLQLDKELTRRLKLLSVNAEATLYMVLLAAFQVLLYRYTNQQDILIGTSTFGRSQAEFWHVVGHFVNPVVIRATLTSATTFKLFLKQIRQTVLAALEHQDYPFLLLVERLQPTRDLSYTPIFQILFVLQKL